VDDRDSDGDDDFERNEAPMSREQLEAESEDSVKNLDRKHNIKENGEGGLSQTLSQSDLK